jgi:hypothetical protein
MHRRQVHPLSGWLSRHLFSTTGACNATIDATDISTSQTLPLNRNRDQNFRYSKHSFNTTDRISLSSYNNSPLFSLTDSAGCDGDLLRYFSRLRAQ